MRVGGQLVRKQPEKDTGILVDSKLNMSQHRAQQKVNKVNTGLR